MTNEGPEKREKWGRQLEFMLAAIGYAVGYGNVWRFPYQTYKYGGGAFLIPFFITMFLAGIPTFGLEVAIGQFSSLGATKSYQEMAPIFWGITNCFKVFAVLVLFEICLNVHN